MLDFYPIRFILTNHWYGRDGHHAAKNGSQHKRSEIFHSYRKFCFTILRMRMNGARKKFIVYTNPRASFNVILTPDFNWFNVNEKYAKWGLPVLKN